MVDGDDLRHLLRYELVNLCCHTGFVRGCAEELTARLPAGALAAPDAVLLCEVARAATAILGRLHHAVDEYRREGAAVLVVAAATYEASVGELLGHADQVLAVWARVMGTIPAGDAGDMQALFESLRCRQGLKRTLRAVLEPHH